MPEETTGRTLLSLRKLIESLKTNSIITDKKSSELFNVTPVDYKEALKNVINVKESDMTVARWFDPVSAGPSVSNKISSKKIVFHHEDEGSNVESIPFENLNPKGCAYPRIAYHGRCWSGFF